MEHNDSIGCTVTECRHHCKDDNYCTLNKIDVVKHESVAKHQNVQIVEVSKQGNNVKITRVLTGDFYIIIEESYESCKKFWF